jgi:hypothetical protein
MADLHDIAEQIRALIHAQAPSMDAAAKSLPDAAVAAAGPAAILIVLIVLFAIIGALSGGKKKKAARAAAQAEAEAEEELPRPGPTRAAPPPAEAKPAEPKGPDKRGEALLEAVVRGRPAKAESPSRELQLAQEEAAQRVAKENPNAAKVLLTGDLLQGFPKLAEEAQALKASKPQRAAQVFRDLGALATGVDLPTARSAYEEAFAIEKNNFWGAIFLARLRAESGAADKALEAAAAGAANAKGPREKTVAAAELGDAHLHANQLDKAREAYSSAVESARMLARSGARDAQHDLSVCINKLGDLEMISKNPDKAKALYEEDLTIARHLAKTAPNSIDAQRDVIISLVKLAEVTRDKAHWTEARDAAETLDRAGKWPASDAWMLDALRKQAAG